MSGAIRSAVARGYTRAAAALRDDAHYQQWNARQALSPAGARTYVDFVSRDVLADFLDDLAKEMGP